MKARGLLAAIALIAATVGGCAAPTEEENPPEDTAAEDEPLNLTVDSLDIVHGSLRVSATTVDGAADVSVRLGGDCEHREVGGGLSTLSTLVWTLGDNDVAASDESDPAAGDNAGHFDVPPLDFARSVLRGRPLDLDGTSFTTSLSVGGTSLDGAPEEAPPEEAEPGADVPSEAPSDPE